MSARRFKRLAAGLASCLAVGACTQAPASAPIYGTLDRPPLPPQLINEGSPVFLITGVLKPMAGASLAGATVRAVDLAGAALAGFEAGALRPDGAFVLGGPITSKLFFAEARLQAGARTLTLRSVLRAEPGQDFVLDAATSAMASKIALAASAGRSIDAFDATEAGRLTSQTRATLGAELDALPFDASAAELGKAFSSLAEARNPALAYRLTNWERSLNGQAALPPPPSPSPQPSPTPTPAPSASPGGPAPK